jgi:hypothetical protein
VRNLRFHHHAEHARNTDPGGVDRCHRGPSAGLACGREPAWAPILPAP